MTDIIKQENTAISIFNTEVMGQLVTFSEMMAKSDIAIPQHLIGKPADCMAVAMQAAQWGMNPFAVAQKTHIVNGKLGYEAQLVSAVIGSSRAITGRFKYEFVGDWSNFKVGVKASEKGLGVRCGAILAGETEITWGHVIYLEFITTRNSPLWKTNPQQQIQYLATKYWARVYTPDVILGVYDKEELEQPQERVEKDITPHTANDLNNMFSQQSTNQEQAESEQPSSNFDNNQNGRDDLEKMADYDGEHPNEIYNRSVNRSNNDLDNEQDFGMTKHEEIKAMIATAKDRYGYREVVKIYTAALTNDEITTDEAEEIKSSLTNLYNQLKKEPQQ
ncbi:recombinase RecT [Vibrio parahaemolyticus]|nr:recombinase RecT [Vibrio parahaemolyticus]